MSSFPFSGAQSASEQMHIPDGFLSPAVALVLWVIAVIVVAVSLRRADRQLGERQVPIMGAIAACIFAGQMLNFAVAGGTSGHLLGAALAAILLGPWAATLVLTAVVSIQALLFQDGGLVVLGANIFNMAVVGVWVGYATYRSVLRLAGQRPWGIFAAGAVAAWLSIVMAALACALELALSGTSPAPLVIPAMGGIHMLIGVGEAIITVGALVFLHAVRRDLFSPETASSSDSRVVWLGGLGVAVLLALLSPFASTHPDGLEWVAEQQGFLGAAQPPVLSIIPDYLFPGIANDTMATIVAGIVGVLIVFGVTMFMTVKRPRAGVVGRGVDGSSH
ncbi:MAG: energy-coupling factor ABC transporter permease [Chloroflexota bacterium]|nr:energy-coupling factor ABC transporter permease [Chloroflexota bacterium]